MGDSQVRRAMAVVFNAVEVVREAYGRRAAGAAVGVWEGGGTWDEAGAPDGRGPGAREGRGPRGREGRGSEGREGRGSGGAGEEGVLVVARGVERRGARRSGGGASAGRRDRAGSGGVGDAGGNALEAAGTVLWSVQGLLVSEGMERYRKRLRDAAEELRALAGTLRRAGERDAADALTDTADTLTAVATIAQISVEAGLAG